MTTTEVSNSIRGIAADSLATVSSLGWNDYITVGEPITVTKAGCIMLTEEVEKAPKETTNILFTEGNSVKVKNCKDGEVKNTKTIMSDIKDIEVKHNGENSTVIFVTFKDGKTEKAVLDKDDEFSLEHGLTIILLKKLLSDKGVDGNSVHNKLVNRALKLYNKLEKEKNDKAKKELEEKERKQRLEEKRRAKKHKQAVAEREYQIEIQKEAYLRAMKAMKEEND